MKRFNYIALGLAGLAFASCSQDEIINNEAGDDKYSVTISLPADLATRADNLGSGLVADKLMAAIYDANGGYIETTEFSFGGELQTTVSLNLVRGTSYYIAFFAQSQESIDQEVYNFDGANAMLSVNYANMTSQANNEDDYDCFYNLLETGVISSTNNTSKITLYRPIAKINWGSSDYTSNVVRDAYSVKNVDSQGNVSYEDYGKIYAELSTTAYTQYNLLHKDIIEGSDEAVTIGRFTPAVGEDFPVDPSTYKYVAMQYVLAPREESGLLNLNLSIWNAATEADATNVTSIQVMSAPVQANFQTNIYGALFTHAVDINVDKSPIWETPSYDIPLAWDGVTATKPVIDSDTKTVTIASASDLAGLAAMVNGGEINGEAQEATDFSGYTVTLSTDIDLNNKPFPGIGTAVYTINQSSTPGTSSYDGTSFKGAFDGKGHTISNLTISRDDNASFIGSLDGGTLENTNFSNVNINGTSAAQTGIVGGISNGGSVADITVSGTVTGGEYTGAIVGALLEEGSISGCTNNATVNGTKYVGGVVGAAVLPQDVNDIVITDCHNNGTVKGGEGAKYVGGVVGMATATISDCSNSASVQSDLNSTGGIAGELRNAGAITGCVNTGVISETGTTSAAWGAAGIVGYVRYYPDGYVNYSLITVTGNTNYADVSGYVGVAGIVGVWFGMGVCDGNFNYAGTITAGSEFAAGIIGDQQWLYVPEDVTPATLSISDNETSTTLENIKCPRNVDLVTYANTPENVIGLDTNKTGVAQQTPPGN